MTLVLAAALLTGCARDPNEGTLNQNAAAAFEPCNEAEIKYMATRHNFMTAFRPCGLNNFNQFAWSPDGTRLYFQLVMTGYVMDAVSETKPTMTVPVRSPIGMAAWLTSDRLVVPVGPATDGGPHELAVVSFHKTATTVEGQAQAGATVSYVPLPANLTEPNDTHRVSNGEVVLLASSGDVRNAWRVDIGSGAASKLDIGPVDTLTWTARANRYVTGVGNTVSVRDATDNSVVRTYPHASRGVVHPKGRWIALEHLGEPVSIFHQRSWDELSEKARAREMARVEQFKKGLPPGYPTDVSPPTISVADLQGDGRWMFSGFLGYRFAWYEATDYYGSFILWGFEGKEYKKNVLLGNFADRLNNLDRGKKLTGVEDFTPPTRIVLPGQTDAEAAQP